MSNIFKEMLTTYSCYCVGGEDPVFLSFEILVEGILIFSEKFGIEPFSRGYIKAIKTCSLDLIHEFMEKFHSEEESVMRARTFIASCFNLD